MIRTDENLMQYIETEVQGGTLYIDISRGYNLNPTGAIEYYIYEAATTTVLTLRAEMHA